LAIVSNTTFSLQVGVLPRLFAALTFTLLH
jgi:hypothetical protein